MVLDLAKAVQVGVIKSDDISPGLIADWLELIEIPETELWFRSSGERRFSEFLVLQSGYSYMHIEPELWPAMKFSNLVWAILRFQLNWPLIKAVKDKHRALCADHSHQSDPAKTIRRSSFINHVKSRRMAHMNRLCSGEPTPPINKSL
nr:dehydrodolichyl diphosphate synthase complex subunit DHDDS-like [Dermacentor andersoni]